jgi:hypothetical protein
LSKGNFRRLIKGDVRAEVVSGLAGISKKIDITRALTHLPQRRTTIMTITTSDTPKVSTGFDINAEFWSVMHELGLTPEDTGGKITFVG